MEIIIKTLGSIFYYVLDRSLYETFLDRGMIMMMLMFRNLHACGYHVPPSVEMLCFPYFLVSDFINCSATSIFLSIEMRIPRIVLSIDLIAATYNHHT
jgi:hypothetical protein